MLESITTSEMIGMACMTSLLVVYAAYKYGDRKKLHESTGSPPSLPSVPFLGSIPFLPWQPAELHTFFTLKAKEIGNVFSFYAGSQYTVVLNGHAAIHEALSKRSTEFADREPMFAEKTVFNPDLCGIITKHYDSKFKKYHQLTLSILKEFGFGTPHVMEARIQEEVEDLIKRLKTLDGQPINPKEHLYHSLLNVISAILFAHRFPQLDDTVRAFVKTIGEFIDEIDPILDVIPSLRHLPKYRAMIADMHRVKTSIRGTVDTLVSVGLGKTDDENFVRSFVEREGKDYDANELAYIVRDLVNGGMQTVGIALQWALLCIGSNKDVQARLRKDIDEVVPRDRLPSLDDKSKLPYVEAVISEVSRRRGLLPFVFPHSTTAATEVGGYQIPANSMVLVNMHSVNMDPDVWTEPDKFQPERFLNEDGQYVNKDKIFPFSLGKRSCPGEEMARHELFLYLTALVQNFEILPSEGLSTITDKPEVIRFSVPASFQVRFIARE